MQISKTIEIGEAAGLLQSHRVIAGAKQLRKALLCGAVAGVFLAQDADPAITEPIAAMCAEKAVPCAWVPSMRELGKACGIQVKAAAAAYCR